MNSEKHLLQQVRRSKIQKYLKQQLCRMRRKGRYCIAYAVSSFSAVSSGQYTFFSRSAILQQTFIQIGRDRSFIDYLSFPVSRDGTVVGRVPVLFLPFEIRFSGLEKKAAGRQVLCTHRRVTPALGARLLRSYVPLRYGPSESGCDNNTCLPADTLLVRKTRILLQHFQFNLITACMDLPVFCDEHGFHSVKTADQFQPFFKSHGEAGCAQGITVY